MTPKQLVEIFGKIHDSIPSMQGDYSLTVSPKVAAGIHQWLPALKLDEQTLIVEGMPARIHVSKTLRGVAWIWKHHES
jgi:hypothetical protein